MSVEVGTLQTGDYSLSGFADKVSIERKSVDDLVQSIQGENRGRFERELQRGANLHRFWVIVEGSMDGIAKGYYMSKILPQSVLQSLFAFQVRYGTSFIFAGSRAGGEYACYSLLTKYLREIQRAVEIATKAGQGLKQPPKPSQVNVRQTQ